MTPTCPPHYTCKFMPVKTPHYWTHWYDGPWGIVATITAIVAVTILLITLAYYWHEGRSNKRTQLLQARREREQREHERFVEEQRTMQLDACKGDKELFELARNTRMM